MFSPKLTLHWGILDECVYLGEFASLLEKLFVLACDMSKLNQACLTTKLSQKFRKFASSKLSLSYSVTSFSFHTIQRMRKQSTVQTAGMHRMVCNSFVLTLHNQGFYQRSPYLKNESELSD